MKSSLKSIDGPQVSLDLNDVSMIEQFGQRDSGAGWLQIKLTLKSGRIIELSMLIAEYDKLLTNWNPPIIPQEAPK